MSGPNPHAQPKPHVQQPSGQYQQPQATQGMTVAPGGNRNAKNMPVGAEGREWSNSLVDCCGDAGTCVLAWLFPCVVYAQNLQRLEHLAAKGVPDPAHGGGCCSGDCWCYGFANGCWGLGWMLQLTPRASVRSRYNIRGGGCEDCCSIFWCTPCALTQESREIELEEQSFGGHAGHQKA